MNNGEEFPAPEPGTQSQAAHAVEASGIGRSDSISEALTATGAIDTDFPSTAVTRKVCKRENYRRESVLRNQMKDAFENVYIHVGEKKERYRSMAEALGEVRRSQQRMEA